MGDIEEVSGDRVSEVLRQQLGPEFISTRRGAGNRELSYLTGCDAIRIANAVFGFNGWTGVSVNVRITLLKYDGVFREDLGYGQAIKLFSQLEAVEKAGKEAQTHAMNLALLNIVEPTGTCIYYKKNMIQKGKHR
ncbi:hypothetical protein KXV97_007720, partial [Aspergillus fumigatus]